MVKYDWKKTSRKTLMILVYFLIGFVMPFDTIPIEIYPVVGVALSDYLKHR